MAAPAPNSTSAALCGNDRSDIGGPVAQNTELGAGRIIFRQAGDLLEQFGAIAS